MYQRCEVDSKQPRRNCASNRLLHALRCTVDKRGACATARRAATLSLTAEVCLQGMVDSNGEPVDAEFYRRFWGLQPVFQNPGPAMRPGPWAGVMADLTAVLAEFGKRKTIAAASSAPDATGRVCSTLDTFLSARASPCRFRQCHLDLLVCHVSPPCGLELASCQVRICCTPSSTAPDKQHCAWRLLHRRGATSSEVPEQPQADAAAAAGRHLPPPLPGPGASTALCSS